jgi:hypothetical protein
VAFVDRSCDISILASPWPASPVAPEPSERTGSESTAGDKIPCGF